MEKQGSLFARAKPAVKAKKKPRGFMDLPGEIRNMIYGYYFQQGFKCEFAGKKAQLGRVQRKYIKFLKPGRYKPGELSETYVNIKSAPVATVRFSRVLGRYERIQGLDTRWDTSLSGLIFVCKQVYAESICFFYKHTTFGFDSPNRIVNFLKVPSARSLANVTRIQLHYHTYGDPKEAVDMRWKQKHLDSWNRTCNRAAKLLVNLERVDIWVHMNEAAIRLNLKVPCLKPILWFRKRRNSPAKTLSKALKEANVHVDTVWSQPGAFEDQRLTNASRTLHCLFGEGIGRVILGFSGREAMADFNDAWENKYAQWRHHLQFARTGW